MSLPGIIILALLMVLTVTASRRWALLGVMTGILFLTQGQSLDLFGLNIYPMRLLGLAGFVRVVQRGEFTSSRINNTDRALVAAYIYVTVVYLIRTAFGYGTSETIEQTSTASKIGLMLDVILGYFAFRGLIENCDDLQWFLRRYVILLAPYVLLLLIERRTGTNPLAIVGAHPTIWIDIDGTRVRCMGSFMHPSLLGTFGASFALLYAGLLRFSADVWRYAAVGGSLCLAIVFLANSGGPLSFLTVGLAVWLLWPLRRKMFVVRRMIVAVLCILALAMKDPVWYLPSKMSNLFGGSGWHRSYLMHQAFIHIDKWWVAGMPMDLTKDWFPYVLLGAADMTNLYLAFGIDGGLMAIVLFVRLLTSAYRDLGRALVTVRKNFPPVPRMELLLWGLGATLTGHVVNFQAITYFDQTNWVWLMQLAAIGSLAQSLNSRNGGRQRHTRPLSLEGRFPKRSQTTL